MLPPSSIQSEAHHPVASDGGSGKFDGALRGLRNRARLIRYPSKPVKSKPNLSATLRLWHKRAGLFAFLFMGWLGFSGFLINQSASWGYDTARIHWSWVMALYNLHPEPPVSGFVSGGHWLAETVDASLLDGKPLRLRVSKQVGMATGGTPDKPLLFVAEPDKVTILAPNGDVIDQMSGYTLPVTTVRRIGVVEGKPIKVVIQDLDAYATTDGLQWDKLPVNSAVSWSEPAPLTAPQQAKALPFSLPSVSVEHVLVDAHSGRIFGTFGAWVINLVGIAAIGLSISGAWIVYRTRQQRKQARR